MQRRLAAAAVRAELAAVSATAAGDRAHAELTAQTARALHDVLQQLRVDGTSARHATVQRVERMQRWSAKHSGADASLHDARDLVAAVLAHLRAAGA